MGYRRGAVRGRATGAVRQPRTAAVQNGGCPRPLSTGTPPDQRDPELSTARRANAPKPPSDRASSWGGRGRDGRTREGLGRSRSLLAARRAFRAGRLRCRRPSPHRRAERAGGSRSGRHGHGNRPARHHLLRDPAGSRPPHWGSPGIRGDDGSSPALTNASAVADVTSRLVNQVGDALRVHGLGRTFADPSPLFAEARAAAVRAAREQAEQIADAAGARIARLVSLVEGPPATDAGFFAFAAASPRPVSRAPEVHPGETEVHVLRPGYAFRWHYGDAGRRSPCQRQPKIDPADSRDPRNGSVSRRQFVDSIGRLRSGSSSDG